MLLLWLRSHVSAKKESQGMQSIPTLGAHRSADEPPNGDDLPVCTGRVRTGVLGDEIVADTSEGVSHHRRNDVERPITGLREPRDFRHPAPGADDEAPKDLVAHGLEDDGRPAARRRKGDGRGPMVEVTVDRDSMGRQVDELHGESSKIEVRQNRLIRPINREHSNALMRSKVSSALTAFILATMFEWKKVEKKKVVDSIVSQTCALSSKTNIPLRKILSSEQRAGWTMQACLRIKRIYSKRLINGAE